MNTDCERIQKCESHCIYFHTQAYCWQFRLISPGGAAKGERKIYYTPEAALKAGLEWIAQGS